MTERLFDLLNSRLPNLIIKGPKRAGQDIRLGDVLENYPNPTRPVDFVVYESDNILAIGLARYDSDRGGAQEDDRTGGYHNCASEVLRYASETHRNLKLIFVNDGPGLLLGSMWDDYAAIERSWSNKIIVATLRMIPERVTYEWLESS